jgi:hypothetical protein
MLVIFEIGSFLMPGLAWTTVLFVLPYIAGMTGMPSLWLMWGLANFAQVGLELRSSQFPTAK